MRNFGRNDDSEMFGQPTLWSLPGGPQLVLGHVSPQDQGMKSPSAVSSQWGSYFVDGQKGEDDDEEQQRVTWCCHCIHTYSTMAIPSVEHIAGVCVWGGGWDIII